MDLRSYISVSCCCYYYCCQPIISLGSWELAGRKKHPHPWEHRKSGALWVPVTCSCWCNSYCIFKPRIQSKSHPPPPPPAHVVSSSIALGLTSHHPTSSPSGAPNRVQQSKPPCTCGMKEGRREGMQLQGSGFSNSRMPKNHMGLLPKLQSPWHPWSFLCCGTRMGPRNGPSSQCPRCRWSLGQGVRKLVLGRKPFCRKAESPQNLGALFYRAEERGPCWCWSPL